MTGTPPQAEVLLQYLPAIYRVALGRFLLAFQKLLLGFDDGIPAADPLERVIDNLADYLDPMRAPEEFLPWLASWTAFSLRADMEPLVQRRFLAHAIQLYRERGTPANLEKLLGIFVGGTVAISEPPASDPRRHFFLVALTVAYEDDVQTLYRLRLIAKWLIELEKPAHTHFEMEMRHSTIQVGVVSTIGVNTLLAKRTGTSQ
jgi:phage tail-like protein